MEIPKLIILLCCSTVALSSHYTHTIPVEGYETELQNLGQHVEIPETPVKVVKITKTVAVKIPVPYPVKVIEKVPYPVHVNKPYPVPVPQIIKVPVAHHHGQEALDVGHENQFQNRQHDGNSYQVQEAVHDTSAPGNSYENSENQSFEGGNHENGYAVSDNEHNSNGGGFYAQPSHDYHGNSDDQIGHNSFESKSYDQAIQNYLNNLKPNNFEGSNGYH